MIEFDNESSVGFCINGEWFWIVKEWERKFGINVRGNKRGKWRVLEIVMVDGNY